MHEAGALAGQRILLLGDDDLVSVALAVFAGHAGAAARPRAVTVLDCDPDLVRYLARRTARPRLPRRGHRARPPRSTARRADRGIRRGLHRIRRTRWPGRSCSCPARWTPWPRAPAGTCSSPSARAGPRRPYDPAPDGGHGARHPLADARVQLLRRGGHPGGHQPPLPPAHHAGQPARPHRAVRRPAVLGADPGRRHPAVPVRGLRGGARGRPRCPLDADRRAEGRRLPRLRRHGAAPAAAARRAGAGRP